MKRLLVVSILGALLVAACSTSAEAQLFRRWRRNNGYYNNGSYATRYNNGYYGNRGYRSYSYVPGAAAAAPARTYVGGGIPGGGNGGYLFNGPNVLPGPAGEYRGMPTGAGANPQYGAAPGGVGAGFGAGMGPAGSKIDAGTGTFGRP